MTGLIGLTSFIVDFSEETASELLEFLSIESVCESKYNVLVWFSYKININALVIISRPYYNW